MKKFFYLFVFFLISTSINASENIINEIIIDGNQRIDKDTIKTYSGAEIGTLIPSPLEMKY